MAKKSLKERLRQKRKDLEKSNNSGFDFFIVKVGTTRMRPLPVGEDEEFGTEVAYIYLNKELGGFISPSSWGEPCAFMEAYQKLSKSKDEDDRALAKTIKPKKKFVVPHIKYKDEKGKEPDTENGAKLLLLTGNQFQDLIDFFLDEEEAGDFTDPKEGYDIKYSRVGTGMLDTKYSQRHCRPTKLAKPFRDEVYDPVAMAKEKTPEYEETQDMLNQFLGLDPDDDDDSGKKKKKKKSKKDKKGKKKKKKSDI